MKRPRIPLWPPGPGIPLVSGPMVRGLLPLAVFVIGITWFSFAPAPDYLLLSVILLVGWVIAWVIGRLLPMGGEHRWRTFAPPTRRHRGRDSRVSTLRYLLQDPGSADDLHAVITSIVLDALRTRGLRLPSGGAPSSAQDEQTLALLGGEVLAYLRAAPGARTRTPAHIDVLLQRIERI